MQKCQLFNDPQIMSERPDPAAELTALSEKICGGTGLPIAEHGTQEELARWFELQQLSQGWSPEDARNYGAMRAELAKTSPSGERVNALGVGLECLRNQYSKEARGISLM